MRPGNWNSPVTMFLVPHCKDRWCDNTAVNLHASADKDHDIKDAFYEEIERLFNQLSVYHMKILLVDFNVKGQENIFKPTIRNESEDLEGNDNGIRLVNFATSKNVKDISTKFLHHNICKYTWISLDDITHQSDILCSGTLEETIITDICFS